jgi:hypothetical protein
MAPEQAAGQKGLTTAVDLHSLGTILYELLTGRPPFCGATRDDTLAQLREQEPVRPGVLQSRCPRDLEAICPNYLWKEPSRRYASAEALADDLRHFQSGEPTHGRPTRVSERALQWTRRKPLVAALVAAVVFTAVLGVAVGFWQWRRTEAMLKDSEASLYDRRIALADRYLANGWALQAEENLERCPPHLRHWEWYYLQRLWRPKVIVLRGHTDRVRKLAYGPQGMYLASAGADRTVRLWDPTSDGEPEYGGRLGRGHGQGAPRAGRACGQEHERGIQPRRRIRPPPEGGEPVCRYPLQV